MIRESSEEHHRPSFTNCILISILSRSNHRNCPVRFVDIASRSFHKFRAIIVSVFSTKPSEFLGSRLTKANASFRLVNLTARIGGIHFRASADAYFHSRSPRDSYAFMKCIRSMHTANKRTAVISLLQFVIAYIYYNARASERGVASFS